MRAVASALVVHGLVQLAHAAESTRHSNVEAASLDVKAKAGVASFVVPVGPEVIVVSGAVVSVGGAVATVNERVAGEASVLPATSVARTATECAPSVSGPSSRGSRSSPTPRSRPGTRRPSWPRST